MTLVRTITCTNTPPNSYEHFEDPPSRIHTIRKLRDILQSDLDSLNDSNDDTCEIMKQIEGSAISSYSAAEDPNDTDPKRAKSRKVRAEKRFQSEQDQYVQIHKKPLLECFSVSEEQELSGELDALNALMETTELKLAPKKIDSVYATLGFNSGYLKKIVNAATPTEGFYSDLRGPLLLAKADEAIQKANNLHTKIQSLRKDVDKQKEIAKALHDKNNDYQNGNVSQNDIRNVESKTGRPSDV